jgi:hypothetical protein
VKQVAFSNHSPFLSDWVYPRSVALFVDGHRAAKIFFTVCDSTAVETDILWILRYPFYLIEESLAGKHANVPLVVAFAFGFSHSFPPLQRR